MEHDKGGIMPEGALLPDGHRGLGTRIRHDRAAQRASATRLIQLEYISRMVGTKLEAKTAMETVGKRVEAQNTVECRTKSPQSSDSLGFRH